MKDAKTIEAEVVPQENSLALATPITNEIAIPDKPQAPQRTAAQAKVDAIADLTHSAYMRASELKLTAEEITGLLADFPDDAFQPGAAGKENLIYIEHASLRDRLNSVIGIGQWALIPRSRWAEDFQTSKGIQASRVYVEAMLMVRGCFVSEAVGEMEYYKNNNSQNYGDAVEGAKTAALRRCCKEFGIGLQAWKRDWCQGWWQRRLSARKQPQASHKAPAESEPGITFAVKSAESVQPQGEVTSRGQVTMVMEKHSKPDAPKPWTAYVIAFSSDGATSEAWTFDKKLAELATNISNTQEMAMITTGPGRKPGTRTLLKLTPAEEPPEEDNVPFSFPTDQNVGNTP